MDREQENDLINGQLEVFKGRLELLDAACKVEECKANKGMPSQVEVCGTLQCTLQPLSWKIVDYVSIIYQNCVHIYTHKYIYEHTITRAYSYAYYVVYRV